MDAAPYLEHSPVTDPGPLRELLTGLPPSPRELRALVPGLVIHADMGPLYGVDLSGRAGEARLRTLAGMLDRLFELDPRPLAEARHPGTRLVGNCRQSSIMYCGMLREAGVPARARAGFSAYFHSPIRGDHWVVERWDAGAARWVLADAELDELLMADNDIGGEFDPDDLPRERFVLAGQAWTACRAGDEDARGYGLNPQVTGLGYIRAQLLRDLAALNRVEVGPWDVWADDVDAELLDVVAQATVDGSPAAAANLWAAHRPLRPPRRFTADETSITITVRLSGALARRLGSRRTFELPDGAGVDALIAEVAALAGLPAGEARGLAVVAGGEFLARGQPLADGQQVDVLVPVAGG